MRAVISVIGKDSVGILAKVSNTCAANSANIIDVTQSVLRDMFVMVMLVELPESEDGLMKLRSSMDVISRELGMQIHVMHEDIFNSMHRI